MQSVGAIRKRVERLDLALQKLERNASQLIVEAGLDVRQRIAEPFQCLNTRQPESNSKKLSSPMPLPGNARAGNVMPLQSRLDESCLEHVGDEVRKQARSGGSSLWRSHGLLDYHETPRQHSQSGQSPRIFFQLLTHSSSHFARLRTHHGDDLRRGRRAKNRSVAKRASEKEIVGTSLTDHNAYARCVDLIVRPDGRIFRHKVSPFNENVRRSLLDTFATKRVARNKRDVPLAPLASRDDFSRCVIEHELQRYAQQCGESVSEVNGNTRGHAGR